MEFPSRSVGLGSHTVTAVAWVTHVAWVRTLAQELPHATGAAKKNPKNEKTNNKADLSMCTETWFT